MNKDDIPMLYILKEEFIKINNDFLAIKHIIKSKNIIKNIGPKIYYKLSIKKNIIYKIEDFYIKTTIDKLLNFLKARLIYISSELKKLN